MTRKGEAPRCGPKVGAEGRGLSEHYDRQICSPTSKFASRVGRSCVPGKPGILVVLDGGYQPGSGVSDEVALATLSATQPPLSFLEVHLPNLRLREAFSCRHPFPISSPQLILNVILFMFL